jgi:hypothetical protein
VKGPLHPITCSKKIEQITYYRYCFFNVQLLTNQKDGTCKGRVSKNSKNKIAWFYLLINEIFSNKGGAAEVSFIGT